MNKEKSIRLNRSRSKEYFKEMIILPNISSIRQASVDRVLTDKNFDEVKYVKTNENCRSFDQLPVLRQSRNNSYDTKYYQALNQPYIKKSPRSKKLESIKKKYKRQGENTIMDDFPLTTKNENENIRYD